MRLTSPLILSPTFLTPRRTICKIKIIINSQLTCICIRKIIVSRHIAFLYSCLLILCYGLGLNSFLSTPKFIKCLTELSERLGLMRDANKSTKMKILKEELLQINQFLPASVYIPFVDNSTRNNCVLHIPPDEARIFQTKERAPVMLCIEIFRPDEMGVVVNQRNN